MTDKHEQTLASAHTHARGISSHSAYSEERASKIIESVRSGQHISTSARLVGLAPHTVYSWMQRGAADNAAKIDSTWADFTRRMDAASAEAEQTMVERFAAGTKKDWRAAESYLVRRFPDRWSATRDGTEASTLGIDLATATRAELEHAIATFDGAAIACRTRLEEMDAQEGRRS